MNNNTQTEDDIREFAKKLPLLKMNNINSMFYEMLPLCGIGPAIAFSRFLTLQKNVVFGSYALINTYRKDHTSIRGEVIEDPIFEKSMYFENAIEAYNKVPDYVYLILYFNFNLYEIIDNEKIKTVDDIIRLTKAIKKQKIDKINEWISNNEHTKNFFIKFDEYINNSKQVRNLANDIKHRGCIVVEGTGLTRNTKVTKIIEGYTIDVTSLVSEIRINLESEIEKLVEIHRQTIELQKDLYMLCGFQNRLKEFFNKHI